MINPVQDTLIEKRLRDLLNNIPDMVSVTSPEGTFTYVSPACKAILGFDPEEMEGRHAWDFIHPEDIDNVLRTSSELINGIYSGTVIFRGLKKDGSYVWMESTGRICRDENGEAIEIHGCARDISERIAYERALEQNNKELQSLTEALEREQLFKDSIIKYNHIGISALDTQFNITEWNPAIEQITGIKREDAIGRSWLDLYPQAKNTEGHYNFLRALKGEVILWNDKPYYKRQGYHSSYLAPLKDHSGNIIGVLALVMDITERKNAENELADQKNFLKQITDHTPNLVYVFDIIDRKELFINLEIHKILGYSPEDYGNDLLSFRAKIGHPDDNHVLVERLEKIRTAADNEVVEDEIRLLDKQGKWRWFQTRLVVFKRTAEGKVWQVLGNAIDITGKKEVEAVMLSLRATEALLQKKDEFISIASHELKTPLTSVKAYMQLLQTSYKALTDETKMQFIDKLTLHVEKLNKLVDDLLDISRIQSGRMTYTMTGFSADEWIKECVDSYQRISQKHKIEYSGSTGKMVEGDKQRLEQVVSNLLSNAIKYSPAGDRVLVNIYPADNTITVEVSDFGIGIPEEKRGKVFDRFYRVEDSPAYISGLGIGLYISKEIIARHGGTIGIKNGNTTGTTVYFTLPVIS
jgi:two-component system CheB/CheR fusion protein